MNSKNIWIILAVIAVIAIGLFMWQGAENKIDDESIVPINGETGDQTIEGDIGKMNDDIFVEITAWSTYYAQTDMENWISHMEDLYNQYGVTEENINAYIDLLEQDFERSAEVAEKYSDRLSELLEIEE
jgi:prefoldin subunit 5